MPILSSATIHDIAPATADGTAAIPTSVAVVDSSSFLTLHYRLSGPAGEIINTFNDKAATLSLGNGELSPAMEQCLIGLPEGTHTTFELPAGAAFGERNVEMQQWVAKTLLARMGDPDERYQVGDVVQFPTPDGTGSYAGAVIASNDTAVQFDFNHPLAGQPVTFEVKLIGVL
jgi:FKBP-type peptidyl-prolyl cis-trans isomerase SlpA